MSVPAGIEAAAHRYLSRITSKFHSIWMEPKSLPILAGPLPSSVDLRSKLLPVKDQGQEGDCTGQGTSCLVEYNTNSPEWLSAPYLYAKGRQAEGTFPADSGCVIGDVVSSANAAPFSVLALISSPPRLRKPWSSASVRSSAS